MQRWTWLQIQHRKPTMLDDYKYNKENLLCLKYAINIVTNTKTYHAVKKNVLKWVHNENTQPDFISHMDKCWGMIFGTFHQLVLVNTTKKTYYAWNLLAIFLPRHARCHAVKKHVSKWFHDENTQLDFIPHMNIFLGMIFGTFWQFGRNWWQIQQWNTMPKTF